VSVRQEYRRLPVLSFIAYRNIPALNPQRLALSVDVPHGLAQNMVAPHGPQPMPVPKNGPQRKHGPQPPQHGPQPSHDAAHPGPPIGGIPAIPGTPGTAGILAFMLSGRFPAATFPICAIAGVAMKSVATNRIAATLTIDNLIIPSPRQYNTVEFEKAIPRGKRSIGIIRRFYTLS
jgi:hypothetical protein